jgi:hypothetical protein
MTCLPHEPLLRGGELVAPCATPRRLRGGTWGGHDMKTRVVRVGMWGGHGKRKNDEKRETGNEKRENGIWGGG